MHDRGEGDWGGRGEYGSYQLCVDVIAYVWTAKILIALHQFSNYCRDTEYLSIMIKRFTIFFFNLIFLPFFQVQRRRGTGVFELPVNIPSSSSSSSWYYRLLIIELYWFLLWLPNVVERQVWRKTRIKILNNQHKSASLKVTYYTCSCILTPPPLQTTTIPFLFLYNLAIYCIVNYIIYYIIFWLKIFLCLVLQVFGTAALIWNTFVYCKHVSGTFRKDIADRILASQGPGPVAINLKTSSLLI